jgi:competence protein ComEC
MLVWDGRWLYNAGFMLSFISVAAIVEWGIPLSRVRLRHRGIWGKAQSEVERIELMRTAKGWVKLIGRRLARSLWTALAISIVASIATMPLVSHMFGIVTLWSIVVGPVMVLLCSIVVGATMVQIAMGCGWTGNFIGGIVELAGGAMNSIADWCSSSGALIAEYHISQLCTIVCYAGFISLTVVKWGMQD